MQKDLEILALVKQCKGVYNFDILQTFANIPIKKEKRKREVLETILYLEFVYNKMEKYKPTKEVKETFEEVGEVLKKATHIFLALYD